MKKAFTLIELLIVIAILGILAVGVLVGINPIEQTRKATDTSLVDIGTEFKSAVDRFYASQNHMPWCAAASAPGTCTATLTCTVAGIAALSAAAGLPLNQAAGCVHDGITVLQANGELKSTFLSAAGNNAQSVFVWSDATGGLYIATGFDPKSNAYDINQNTNILNTAGCTQASLGQAPGTACPVGTVGTAGNNCWYCIR